ncbi:MAG: sigma-70 family RNA polymerase sigma factor [Actinomycetota bacterium]|nr:sigma-70 family RNA polymerase sigma factor [Actinomycetota bacterium]
MSVETRRDFARLYEQEGRRVWRAVYAFAGDREVASDAVAEAFAQCIRRGEAVRDPRAWVWRTAFRIAAGELKERRRRTTFTKEPTYEMDEPPGPLLAALAALPGNQRAALVLRYYAGHDTAAIADALGCSRATVRVHLSRGKRSLRGMLEGQT